MQVEEYDYVILGTGVVECSVGCILSANNKKVIHIDRNKIYGTDFSTMKYTELEAYFKSTQVDTTLSKLDREFNIDLTPKLLLADSAMKNILLKYNIDEYITFSRIPGSFIYKQKLHAVPTNETQSLKTGIIGTWQKHKVIRFFWNVRDYAKCKLENRTFKCCKTMREQFDKYGLNDESREFIGHAIALNLDDSYLDRHPYETFDKIFLYVSSVMCYENNLKSPYIYPEYGLSEISQGFARKSAIQGSVFMLNTDILSMDLEKCEIKIREPMDGITLLIRGKKIIADQSYIYDNAYEIIGKPSSAKHDLLDEKIKSLNLSESVNAGPLNTVEKAAEQKLRSDSLDDGLPSKSVSDPEYYEIIRNICILKGEAEELTRKATSAQVIFLKSELKRKNDVFVVVLGNAEKAAPAGYKVAIISTVKETDDPHKEIAPVLSKMSNILRSFLSVKRVYRTSNTDRVIFTRGIDETTHFESIYAEIKHICESLGYEGELEEAQ